MLAAPNASYGIAAFPAPITTTTVCARVAVPYPLPTASLPYLTPRTHSASPLLLYSHRLPSALGSTAVVTAISSSGTSHTPAKAGDVVRMDKRVIEVSGKLGQGNFGVVWEAHERDGPEELEPFALKVSTPSTVDNFNAAVFEADVLRLLEKRLQENCGQEGVAKVSCVPRYIGHQISLIPGRPGKGTVTLAMSKVDGRPLDRWLYGPTFSESRLRTIKMEELLDGPLPDSQLATRGLDGAAKAAAELLRQMAPVFGALEGIAFHRDVSAHNFLVQEEEGGRLNFTIIDFGLAVRSRTWKHDYKSNNLAGTPNYFPPSTWMFFTQGYRYLEEHPNDGFLRQYQERLDHFAVGALALELFFVLWNGDGCVADAEDKFKDARKVWRSYWKHAVKLYQDFFTKGPSSLRKALQGSREVSAFAEAVNSLMISLRAAASTVPDSLAGRVLEAAAVLMDPKGTAQWADIPSLLIQCDGESTAASGSETDDVELVRSVTLSKIEATEPQTPARSRTYSHRRVWTVDEAVSLKRGVPDIGMSGISEEGSTKADKSIEMEPPATSPAPKHNDVGRKPGPEPAGARGAPVALSTWRRVSGPLLGQCLPNLMAGASSTAPAAVKTNSAIPTVHQHSTPV